jgi:hypothetical protein
MRSLAALVAAGLLFAGDQGRPSPPLTVLQPSGPSITLKQYLGKAVVVAFIQTPSMECQSLIPLLAPIARDYGPRGVQVLVVAFDETAAGAVPSLVARYTPPFPVGWTHPNAVRAYFPEDEPKAEPKTDQKPEQKSEQKSKEFAIPRLIFIDRKGIIRGDFPGDRPFFKDPAANIRSELNAVLK